MPAGRAAAGAGAKPVPSAHPASDRCNPHSRRRRCRCAIGRSCPTARSPRPCHLPLAGSPVTPNAVPLLSHRLRQSCRRERLHLPDGAGRQRRCAGRNISASLAAANASDPANFDLSVVFNPAGRPRRHDQPDGAREVYRSFADAGDRQLRRDRSSTRRRGSSASRPPTRRRPQPSGVSRRRRPCWRTPARSSCRTRATAPI